MPAQYHVYSQTVADGTATSQVRPSDWNSVHAQNFTLAGNTAGASTGSGTNIIYQGGNNVTLSVNQGAGAATIVISGSNQSVQTQAAGNIAGIGYTSTTQAGSTVGATQNTAGLSVAWPPFITTTPAQTAYVFSNSNNVSFGTNGSTVTATASFAQSVQTQAAGNIAGTGYTSTTQAGSTVGVTDNTAGLSVAWPPFITTYAAQSTQTQPAGNIAGVGTTFAGTGINGSMTLNSNGLNLALSEVAGTDSFYATGANTIAGTNTSGTFVNDQYVFSGAGILSVGISNNTVVLSVPSGGGGGDGYNSAQFTNSTANSTMPLVWAGNSNGSGNVTMGLTGSTVTMSAPAGMNISVSNTSSNLTQLVFPNSNGVTWGLTSNSITANIPMLVSAANGSGSMAVLSFADAGGVSWSTNANGVQAAVNTAPDTVFIVGNTAGTASTFTGDAFYFSGGNNMTLSNNGGTVVFSAGAGGGGGVTWSNFSPFIAGSKAAITVGQNSLMLWPFWAPQNVTFNNVVQHVQMTVATSSVAPVTNSTTTTGSTGSNSAGQTIEFYLFARGTGGYSTNLYTVGSTSATMSSFASWSQTNSNTTTGTNTLGSSVWFTCGFPTLTSGTSNSGGSTVTTWQATTGTFGGTTNTSSAVFPSVTAMTGYKGFFMPWASSLSPGQYYLGLKRQSTTSGGYNGAGAFSVNVVTFQSMDSLSAVGLPGVGTAVSVIPGGAYGFGYGTFSATYNTSVSTFASSGQSSGAIAGSQVLAHSPTATITLHQPIFFFNNGVF